MTKHTEGDWRVFHESEDSEFGLYSIYSDSEATCFAPIGDFRLAEASIAEPSGNDSHYSIGRAECLANARLCASAPELLAACQKLIDCLVESHQDELNNDHFGDNPAGCTYCQVILEGGAAITKAFEGDE